MKNYFLTITRSTTLLIVSDILKSSIKLLRTCPSCSNKSIDIKCDQSQKKGIGFIFLKILYAIQKYSNAVSPFTLLNV